MSDLVVRLRRLKTIAACQEAADEIERLRAEVETWIRHTRTAVWSDIEQCKLLEAENKRLRAALDDAENKKGGTAVKMPP
jgi:hypothetical protein